MSDNQRYGIGLALVLMAGSAMAEDLPQQSILKRYGVTPDQLPAAAQATEKRSAARTGQPLSYRRRAALGECDPGGG